MSPVRRERNDEKPGGTSFLACLLSRQCTLSRQGCLRSQRSLSDGPCDAREMMKMPMYSRGGQPC